MAIVAGAAAEQFEIDDAPIVEVGHAAYATGKLAADAPSRAFTNSPLDPDLGSRFIGLGPDGGSIMVSPEQWAEIQKRQEKDDWFIGPEDAGTNSTDTPATVRQDRQDSPAVPSGGSNELTRSGYIGLAPDGGGIMVTPKEFERIQREDKNDWFISPEDADSNKAPEPATPKDDQAAPKAKQDAPRPTSRNGFVSPPSNPATLTGRLHREIGKLEGELQRRQQRNEDSGDLAKRIAAKHEQLIAEATRFGKTGTHSPSTSDPNAVAEDGVATEEESKGAKQTEPDEDRSEELAKPKSPLPSDEDITLDRVDDEIPNPRPTPNVETGGFEAAEAKLSKNAIDEIMREFGESVRSRNRPPSNPVQTAPATPVAPQTPRDDGVTEPTEPVGKTTGPQPATSQPTSGQAAAPPHQPFSRGDWWWAAGIGLISSPFTGQFWKAGWWNGLNFFTIGQVSYFSKAAAKSQQASGIKASDRASMHWWTLGTAISLYLLAGLILVACRVAKSGRSVFRVGTWCKQAVKVGSDLLKCGKTLVEKCTSAWDWIRSKVSPPAPKAVFPTREAAEQAAKWNHRVILKETWSKVLTSERSPWNGKLKLVYSWMPTAIEGYKVVGGKALTEYWLVVSAILSNLVLWGVRWLGGPNLSGVSCTFDDPGHEDLPK
jgi:hypothetical protein